MPAFLLTLFCLYPFIFLIFGPASFIGLIIAALLIIGVAAINGKLSLSGIVSYLKSPIVFTPMLLLGYAGLTTFWSVAPDRSLEASRNLFGLFIITAVSLIALRSLRPASRVELVAYPAALMALLIITEATGDYPVTRFIRHNLGLSEIIHQPMDKGISLFCLMFPAILFAVSSEWKKYIPLFIFVSIALCQQPMFAGILAVFATMIAYQAAMRFGGYFVSAFFSCVLLGFLTAPFMIDAVKGLDIYTYTVERLPLSWQYRVLMWDRASEIFLIKPFTGWGFDATRQIEETLGITRPVFQNHPHNIILQVWLELGFLGVLIAVAIIISVWSLLLSIKSRELTALWTSFAASYLVFASVSFSSWQEWWFANLMLGIIFTAFIAKSRPIPGRS